MLEVMDKVAPGINSPSTLLYGVEVKFYSTRLKLTGTMETEVKNLFAAGDGAGVTRGHCAGIGIGRHGREGNSGAHGWKVKRGKTLASFLSNPEALENRERREGHEKHGLSKSRARKSGSI